MPGIAASTSDTWLLGSPPNWVEAPENSFEFEVTWAWTSSPITISQSPVAPLISFDGLTGAFMFFRLEAAPPRLAPTPPRPDCSQRACRRAGTNSRHCRDRLRPDADRHEPMPRPHRFRPARFGARGSNRPWQPTTTRRAAAKGRARVLRRKDLI